MLPRSNFQEDPRPVWHRTSPTNIGLYLLATVSARDFGWIGTNAAVKRLGQPGHHATARALPWPFLQLVRHVGSSPAGAALRFVRRQRQPRGTPHDDGSAARQWIDVPPGRDIGGRD